MASKKDKNEIDSDFNLDDDLDFGDFDFDLAPEKDDRSPAKKFKDGFTQGVIDKVKDTDYLRRFAKESLPEGYGQTIDMAGTVTQNIRKNIDEVSSTVKPLIKDTKRVLTKVIPRDSKFLPKSAKDMLDRWEDDSKSEQRADMSKQRMKEDFMNAQLADVFKVQMEQQAESQQQQDAKQAISDKIDSDRFNSNFALMNQIAKSSSKMEQYQQTITTAYYKKDLEIQFRQLFTLQDILEQSKLDSVVMKSGLEKIVKNTGLPEYAKIKEGERFKDLMKNKFINSAYGGLFKGRDEFINKLFGGIRDKINGKVNQFTSGLRMGLMQVEQGADMAKAMSGDGMPAIDKVEIGGSLAGDYATEKYGMKLGAFLKGHAQKNKKIMDLNDKLLDYNLNKDRYLAEFRDSDKYTYDDSIKGSLMRLIQSALPRNSVDTGLEVQKTEGLHDPYIYTKRTDRSINEIIPGYLSRILREIQVFRTGDTSIQVTEFNHEKGVFSSSSAIDEQFHKKLNSEYSQKSSNDNITKLIDSLGGDLSPEEKKALRKSILKTAVDGKLLSAQNITKSSNFTDGDEAYKDSIYEKLNASMANLTPEQKRTSDNLLNAVRAGVADPRKMIQDMVNMGETDRLKRLGYISDNNGLDFDLADHLKSYYDEEHRGKRSKIDGIQDVNIVRPNAQPRDINVGSLNVPEFIKSFQEYSVSKPIYVRIHPDGLDDFKKMFWDIPTKKALSIDKAQDQSGQPPTPGGNNVNNIKNIKNVKRINVESLNIPKFIQSFQEYTVTKPIYVRIHGDGIDDIKKMLESITPKAPPPTNTPPSGGTPNPKPSPNGNAANDDRAGDIPPGTDTNSNRQTRSANDDVIRDINKRVSAQVSNGVTAITAGFTAMMNGFTAGYNGTAQQGGNEIDVNNSANQANADGTNAPVVVRTTGEVIKPSAIVIGQFASRMATRFNEITNEENRKKAMGIISNIQVRSMKEYRSLVNKANEFYNQNVNTNTMPTDDEFVGPIKPSAPTNSASATTQTNNGEEPKTMEDLHKQNQMTNQIITAQLMANVTESPAAMARAIPVLKYLKAQGIKNLAPEAMKTFFKKVKSSKIFDKSSAPRDSGIIDVEAREITPQLAIANNPSTSSSEKAKPKNVREYLDAIYEQLIKISDSTFKFSTMDFSKISSRMKAGASELSGKVSEKAQAARNYIKENFPDLLEDFDDRYDEVSGRVKAGVDKAKDKARAKWSEAKSYLDENYPELADMLNPNEGTIDEKKQKIKEFLSSTRDGVNQKINNFKSNMSNPNMVFDSSLPGLVSFMAYKVSEYLGKGFKAGKGIFDWSIGNTGKMLGFLKDKAKDMFATNIYDVYVEGDNKPRLTSANIAAGKYHFTHNNKVLESSKDILWPVADEDGQILITEEELGKLFYLDPKTRVMKKFKESKLNIGAGLRFAKDKILQLYPKVFAAQFDMIRSARNLIGEAKKKVTGFAFDMLDPPEDVYVVGSPTPALLARVMIGGGYVSSQNHDKKIRRPSDIDGPVMDITGEKPVTALSMDDLKKGLVDANGKSFKTIGSKVRDFFKGIFQKGLDVAKWGWGLTKGVAGRLSKGIKGLFGDLSIEINGKKSADTLIKIHDFITTRFASKKKLGDKDGDGVVENSYQDYQRKKEQNKKPAEPAKAEKPKEKKDDGFLSKFGNIFGKVGNIVGGLTKGVGMFARIFTGGIKALGTVGRLAMGVVRIVSTVARVASVGSLVSSVVGMGSTLVAAGGAIVSGVGAIASGVIGVLSSPVVLPILAAGAVAYAGYKLYKKYKKGKKSIPKNIRLAQYGFDPKDPKIDESAIYNLEEMLFGKIKINDRKGASIVMEQDDVVKAMELFGLDKNDNSHKEKFTGWFNNRFKPIYLTHAVLATKAYKMSSMTDLDGLEGKDLAQHIKACKNQSQAYNYNILPTVNEMTAFTAEQVNAYLDEVMAQIDKDSKDGSKTTVGEGADKKELNRPTPLKGAPSSHLNDPNYSSSASKSGSKISSSATSVDIATLYKNRLDAIDAIRLKIYGLKEINTSKLTAIKKLEKIVSEKINFTGGSTAKWDGDPNEIMKQVAGLFSIDIEKGTNTTTWLVWFTKRFLPTYLTFASAIKDITKTDKLQNYGLFKASDILDIARRLISDSAVWTEGGNIWPGEEINKDPKSIEGNLNALEKIVSDTKLAEQSANKPKKDTDNTSKPKTESQSTTVKVNSPGSNNTYVAREATKAPDSSKNNTGKAFASRKDDKPIPMEAEPTKSGSGPAATSAAANDKKDLGVAASPPSSLPMADGAVIQNADKSSVRVDRDVDLDGVHPELLKNVLGMAQEYKQLTGKKMLITSGSRTTEKQEYLYKTLPKGKAARPGTSFHEFGLAVDMNSKDDSLQWAEKNGLLKKYGLTRPIGGEPWHIEAAGLQTANRRKFLSRKNWDESGAIIRNSLGQGGGGIGSVPGSKLGAFSVQAANKTAQAKPTIVTPKPVDPDKPTSSETAAPTPVKSTENKQPDTTATTAPKSSSVSTPKETPKETTPPKEETKPEPKVSVAQTQRSNFAPRTPTKPIQPYGEAPPPAAPPLMRDDSRRDKKPTSVDNPFADQDQSLADTADAAAQTVEQQTIKPNRVASFRRPGISDSIRQATSVPLNNPFSFMPSQVRQSIKNDGKAQTSLDIKLMDQTNEILKQQLDEMKLLHDTVKSIKELISNKNSVGDKVDTVEKKPIQSTRESGPHRVSIEDVPVPMRSMYS